MTGSGARPPVAFYVHLPFCVSVCPYCDFVVYAGASARGPRNRVSVLLEALRAEIGLRADALDARFGEPDARPEARGAPSSRRSTSAGGPRR